MSRNVRAIGYRRAELVERIVQWSERPEKIELINAILDSCGETIDNVYIILHNEHYEDENAYYQLMTLLECAFEKSSLECFFGAKSANNVEALGYVEGEEVADQLGFEWDEEGFENGV